ncbi:MAG TPA: hypothetical protein VG537_08075 [Candidatus Kapabacteria bacterium]|jgi:hypothetical protein|nr:hypothetical protein [Candidatus Kapabacteria bacterium]
MSEEIQNNSEQSELPTEVNANDAATIIEAAPATEPRKRREKKPRGDVARRPREKRPAKSHPFERFVVITWSAMREPVDTMYWAEAVRDGQWMIVEEVVPVRTRREILDRLMELPNGLVALEFPFSYPQDFLGFLQSKFGIEDWRALIKRVREDLKKNVDDGVRIWIERMGEYRESQLDPNPPPVFSRDERRGPDRRFGDRRFNDRESRGEPLPPYEQRSIAERFRRTDLTIRKAAGAELVSPIQIAYNRLTKRYEFSDPNVRGRAALLGMSMLDQLLEARPEVAIWPMARPKPVTIVELQPWIFTGGSTLAPDELRTMLARYEDNGWEIPSNATDAAARNASAQRALLSLIGTIKTETREDRERRPLRDYVDGFYADPQVQAEGWFYSVGYRMTDAQREPVNESAPQKEKQKSERPKKEMPAVEETKETRAPIAIEENPIVSEPSAETIEHEPVPEAAEVHAEENE